MYQYVSPRQNGVEIYRRNKTNTPQVNYATYNNGAFQGDFQFLVMLRFTFWRRKTCRIISLKSSRSWTIPAAGFIENLSSPLFLTGASEPTMDAPVFFIMPCSAPTQLPHLVSPDRRHHIYGLSRRVGLYFEGAGGVAANSDKAACFRYPGGFAIRPSNWVQASGAR